MLMTFIIVQVRYRKIIYISKLTYITQIAYIYTVSVFNWNHIYTYTCIRYVVFAFCDEVNQPISLQQDLNANPNTTRIRLCQH